jgi:hypothetical protein
MNDTQPPAVPGQLRAGQLGVVVLGRVIMGDIAVTLVDLTLRKLLRVEESEADHDWLLHPMLAAAPRHKRESLLGYEERLLNTLAGFGSTSRLSELGAQLGPGLDRVRGALVHEAVRQGWLRDVHKDERTPEGEELARDVRSFQRELRHYAEAQGTASVAGPLLPYALHFGLIPVGAAHEEATAVPLARFAHAWAYTFKDLPGWRVVPAKRQQVTDADLRSEADESLAANAPGGFLPTIRN